MNATDTCTVLPAGTDQLLDRAEQLIWNLLDDDLSEEAVFELESIFREQPSVREVYINCVQLHVTLAEHAGRASKIAFPEWLSAPI